MRPIVRCSLVAERKARAARKELKRILQTEATHEALDPHFIRRRVVHYDIESSPLITLRKSLRRVHQILDGRTR